MDVDEETSTMETHYDQFLLAAGNIQLTYRLMHRKITELQEDRGLKAYTSVFLIGKKIKVIKLWDAVSKVQNLILPSTFKGVNLQSGKVVVVGKKQKVRRRIRHEVEEEEEEEESDGVESTDKVRLNVTGDNNNKVEVVADKDDATPENVEEPLTMNILENNTAVGINERNVTVERMSGGVFGVNSDVLSFDTPACTVSRPKSVQKGANIQTHWEKILEPGVRHIHIY
ncbi:hypothetical protein Tco_0568646 [Tanacetum coccineum]